MREGKAHFLPISFPALLKALASALMESGMNGISERPARVNKILLQYSMSDRLILYSTKPAKVLFQPLAAMGCYLQFIPPFNSESSGQELRKHRRLAHSSRA